MNVELGNVIGTPAISCTDGAEPMVVLVREDIDRIMDWFSFASDVRDDPADSNLHERLLTLSGFSFWDAAS